MPSAQQIFEVLLQVESHLNGVKPKLDQIDSSVDAVKSATDQVRGAVEDVNDTLKKGFGDLITLQTYANEALAHNAEQNDTIICVLEKISRNTCALVNYAAIQTRLQTSIEQSTSILATLYAATHAEAELERQRDEALRKQIEECCPPEQPRPPCEYEPCPKPEPLREPPKVDTPAGKTKEPK